MKNAWVVFLSIVIFLAYAPSVFATRLPEFTSTLPEHWINSGPLTTSDLKGKIVLLEVWTSI